MTLIKILSIIEKKTIINYFSNVIKQRVENKRNELKYFIIGRKKKKKCIISVRYYGVSEFGTRTNRNKLLLENIGSGIGVFE